MIRRFLWSLRSTGEHPWKRVDSLRDGNQQLAWPALRTSECQALVEEKRARERLNVA
ncbi:MAG TPA: hypothetical protein VGF67_10410 [Ktedonobacteraceae bacterium]|jgi:hypothetical protein